MTCCLLVDAVDEALFGAGQLPLQPRPGERYREMLVQLELAIVT